MHEIELTWVHVLKIWWLMLWRGVLMVLAAAFVAGATLGAILVLLKVPFVHDPVKMRFAGQIAGFLISIPIYWVVIWMALRKKYRDFRLAVIPPDSPAP